MRDINDIKEAIDKINQAAKRIRKKIYYHHGKNFTVPSYVSEQLTDIDIIEICAGTINRKIENCMKGVIKE